MYRITVIKKDRILNPTEVRKFFDQLPDGESVLIRQEDPRTLSQQGYYRGVICKEVATELRRRGYFVTAEDVHRMFAQRFLKYEKEIMGVMVSMVKSTTELSKSEMNEYMELCRIWAAQTLDLLIKDPE